MRCLYRHCVCLAVCADIVRRLYRHRVCLALSKRAREMTWARMSRGEAVCRAGVATAIAWPGAVSACH